MKRSLLGGLIIGLVVVAWLGFRLISSPSATGKTLVVTGSSSVAPLVSDIAKRYESLHPSVRMDVQTGGSSRGLADARQKLNDIGMVSRELRPNENDLSSFPLARDGIAMIVHRDNPVTALDSEQIVALYTGKIRNWREVGGDDQQVTVVNKADGRSTLELFLKHFKLKNPDVQADVIIGDNEQGIKTVAGNPGAIGYVSIGAAEYNVEQGVAIKALPLDGVAASIENVKNGTFSLSRVLIMVTNGEPQNLAKEFIEFARSAQVHDLVREHYLVPITPKN